LVHVATGRDEEELRLEVLRFVSRERLECLAVQPEDPAGEEARVAEEETVRLVERRFDVAAAVADQKRRAIEDADLVMRHHWASLGRVARPGSRTTGTAPEDE